jgi:hypothetical protein
MKQLSDSGSTPRRRNPVRTVREDIERDLASDRVRESVVRELLLEGVDKLGADAVDLVVSLKVVALLDAADGSEG